MFEIALSLNEILERGFVSFLTLCWFCDYLETLLLVAMVSLMRIVQGWFVPVEWEGDPIGPIERSSWRPGQ